MKILLTKPVLAFMCTGTPSAQEAAFDRLVQSINHWVVWGLVFGWIGYVVYKLMTDQKPLRQKIPSLAILLSIEIGVYVMFVISVWVISIATGNWC